MFDILKDVCYNNIINETGEYSIGGINYESNLKSKGAYARIH